MNAKLLDNQLRMLTAEEIEARGGKETDYSVFQFVEGRGGNYFLMTKGKIFTILISPLYRIQDLFL